ncbi:MAG TPA: hypothetical protein PLE63_11145, partial [Thermoleophilia bacterium]|nr:hypothetical protein [Thermoleophilia bacterium]
MEGGQVVGRAEPDGDTLTLGATDVLTGLLAHPPQDVLRHAGDVQQHGRPGLVGDPALAEAVSGEQVEHRCSDGHRRFELEEHGALRPRAALELRQQEGGHLLLVPATH